MTEEDRNCLTGKLKECERLRVAGIPLVRKSFKLPSGIRVVIESRGNSWAWTTFGVSVALESGTYGDIPNDHN